MSEEEESSCPDCGALLEWGECPNCDFGHEAKGRVEKKMSEERKKQFAEFISLKKREREIINSLSLGDSIDLCFEATEQGIKFGCGV